MPRPARLELVILAAAAAAATSGPAGGQATTPTKLSRAAIIYGYPYAADCPLAGVAKKVDRFGMYECNCTSYVAWALHVNGLRTDWFIPGAMDAWNWPHVAQLRGLRVTDAPALRAVAVWPHLGRLGHVAFVTQVAAGGRFSAAEYNVPPVWSATHLEFDIRSNLSPAGVRFILVPEAAAVAADSTIATTR